MKKEEEFFINLKFIESYYIAIHFTKHFMCIIIFSRHKKPYNTGTVIILPEIRKPRLRDVMEFAPVTQLGSSESGFHPTQSSHF